jgi:protocatechuate 3,4-dioxygenase beta subunit
MRRTTPWVFLALIAWSIAASAHAQTFSLQPPKVLSSDGTADVKLLVKRDRTVRLDWNAAQGASYSLTGRNAVLVIGRVPNTYDHLQVAVTGNRLDFTPNAIGLAPGKYYARITNGSGRTTSAILGNFQDAPSTIVFSNEIEIIVEAPTAAFPIAPRGNITSGTPTFSWEPVPGVVAYWIIVSSTPFKIEEGSDGSISITGVTGVWQYITTGTSATYGAVSDAFPDEPPPLNAAREYSYTILNLYADQNPVYVSPVFGGIIPFRYVNPTALPAPVLTTPANNAVLVASPQITFQWRAVAGATNYSVRLSKMLTQAGAEVAIPIWTSTTTNTLLDLNAPGFMENASYRWMVVANDELGNGTSSVTHAFRYQTPAGEFSVSAVDANDNSTLVGVEVKTVAINEGATSTVGYILQGTSLSDSLVVGTYEFQATKQGYEPLSVIATIRQNQTSYVSLPMRSQPSSIVGRVVDETGAAVAEAMVRVVDIMSGAQRTTLSTNLGDFSIQVNPGSYSVIATKAGYIASGARNLTVDLGESQNETATPFQIRNDKATISGTVTNQSSSAISLARVRLRSGTTDVEVLTNSEGFYTADVASGTWSLSASKTGFVASQSVSVSASVGALIQNQNFKLASGANQVTGVVRRAVTTADGQTGFSAFAGVTVSAIPTTGSAVSTTTGSNGAYSLSLTSGNYTIRLVRDGFSTSSSATLVLNVQETVNGVDFVMIPNPSSVSGRVIGADGVGISGVIIRSTSGASTETTPAGNFTISLSEGTHTLTATRTGYVAGGSQTVTVAAEQQVTGVEFRMSANAGVIAGRISSAGLSLPSATVSARSLSTSLTTTQTSDSDGLFTMSLQPGRYRVVVSRTGFLPSTADTLTLGPGQQITGRSYTLTENTARINGIVTDANGPVRNMRVVVTSVTDPTNTQSSLTLINGSFSFTVPAGSAYQVRTESVQYASAIASTAVLSASQTAVNLSLSLTPNPSSFSGTVRNQSGNPMANVRILARTVADNQPVDSALTRANGTFALGLPAGSYTVSARLPGHTVDRRNLNLSIGDNLLDTDFQVAENFGFITGLVTDATGSPLAGALVNIQSSVGTGASLITDGNGAFSAARMIGGTYRVEVSRSGHINRTLSGIVLSDGQTRRVDVALALATGSISGSIRQAGMGTGVPGASVTATSETGTEYVTVTSPDGTYTLSLLPPGTYVVDVSATGYGVATPVEAYITEQALTLTGVDISDMVPNDAVITGTVTNFSGGATLTGVQVTVQGTAGSGSAITASNGTYRIPNLAPGRYELRANLSSFRSQSFVLDVAASETASQNVVLRRDAGRIKGRVTNQNGLPLAVAAEIQFVTGDRSYRVTTSTSGFYEIGDMPTGVTYQVATRVFRPGHVNADRILAYEDGAEEATMDLSVTVNVGRISGNVGRSGVTVTLLAMPDETVVTSVSSADDGSYAFNLLPAGDFQVRVNRTGFVFNPAASATLTLPIGGTASFNSTPTANLGSISVLVTASGQPFANVPVTIIGSDGSVNRTASTNAQGTVTVSDLPAGATYAVTPSRTGYTFDPSRREVAVPLNGTATAAFAGLPNSASLTGTVRRIVGTDRPTIPDASVRLQNIANGTMRIVQSQWNGVFSFSSISAGQYLLIGTKSGFTTDTVTVTVGVGENVTGLFVDLESAVINLAGQVTRIGQPVSGVTVTAVGSTSRSTTTGSDGRFYLQDYPIRTGLSDTTTFEVRATVGDVTLTRLLSVDGSQVGQWVGTGDFLVPSGQVRIRTSDGVHPLPGVQIQFGRQGGTPVSALIGNTALFVSNENLRQATYVANVERLGYLRPVNPTVISLPTDTSRVETTILMPYQITPLTQILADEPSMVRISHSSSFVPITPVLKLHYRQSSSSNFTSIDMAATPDGFEAQIPALLSIEPVVYYVTATHDGQSYRSIDRTLTPLASGILSSFRYTPQIAGLTLRVNDSYTLSLAIADGLNKSILDDFQSGSGTITWTLPAGLVLEGGAGTTIQFKATASGNYTLRTLLSLNGVELTGSQSITVTDAPVTSLTLQAPSAQVSNASTVAFSYTARDATGRALALGSGLEWNVIPSVAGTITPSGVFRAASTSYLGEFQVQVRDTRTGIIQTTQPVVLGASLQPNQSYALTDLQGMTLRIPTQSVVGPSDVTLRKVRPEPVKRYVMPFGTDISYTTSETVYRFNLSTGGFVRDVELEVPVDNSFRFLEGEKAVAFFDPVVLSWRLLDSRVSGSLPRSLPDEALSQTSIGDIRSVGGLRSLGQFAVLSQNQPLGLRHMAVLPTPFSPDAGPVRIGYLLDTAYPPALVNIRIYNIRGELVRHLLKDDLQQPGRYGSASGLAQILWDGRTDAGTMARNGRYIIEIRLKDSVADKVEYLPVVLIK